MPKATSFRPGQTVLINTIGKAKLLIDGKVYFDFDKKRGNSGVVERVEPHDVGGTVYVRLNAPNIGVMSVSARYLQVADNAIDGTYRVRKPRQLRGPLKDWEKH